MTLDFETLKFVGKQSVIFLSIILVYLLFVLPKDKMINKLIHNNEKVINENSKELSRVASTMEKVSTELTHLNKNQMKLKDGQDDLWKEIVKIKTKNNE